MDWQLILLILGLICFALAAIKALDAMTSTWPVSLIPLGLFFVFVRALLP